MGTISHWNVANMCHNNNNNKSIRNNNHGAEATVVEFVWAKMTQNAMHNNHNNNNKATKMNSFMLLLHTRTCLTFFSFHGLAADT